jgi:hypothetical protein
LRSSLCGKISIPSMNVPAIAHLLFPSRTMEEMLFDYASHYAPTRLQDDCYEVFISGEWVGLPSDYGMLRKLLGSRVDMLQS